MVARRWMGGRVMPGFRPIAACACTLVAGLTAMPTTAAPVSRPAGAQGCIDSRYIDGQRAEDENTILFTIGSRAYRNHLRTTCPGLLRLNRLDSLEMEPSMGSQLCEGDRVRVFDPWSVRAVGIQAYPICVLGW